MQTTRRRAHSRYFTLEEVHKGFGILILEAKDFPRTERTRLVSELLAAYDAGSLTGDVLDFARRVALALQAPCSTMEGLRLHLRADGREMINKIRQVALVVPATRTLLNWL